MFVSGNTKDTSWLDESEWWKKQNGQWPSDGNGNEAMNDT